MNDPAESSIAIVVTHNRKELLVQCIEALLLQKKNLDKILIVDNCSSDGTESYLSEKGILDNQIVSYVNTYKNMGGAGGFSYGISFALKENYTWLWLMDDDAIPDHACFAKLCNFREHDTVLCPLCVDDKNNNKLAFAAPIPTNPGQTTWFIDEIKDTAHGDLLQGWGAFFNGTLIHNSIIRKIGNIKSEMFIWGDEEEYRLRVKSYDYKITTIMSAILRHPKERCDWIAISKRRKVIKFTAGWKIYSYYRNRGYISRRYSSYNGIFTFLMYTYYFFFIEKSISKYKFFIVAWCDGYFNLYKRTLPF
ncbi:hypothetical protein A6M27_18465 [Acidithiobacillus thiooxidans]|uniref:Glycosyltransferase 2-like domain-containing protein n=2 Tax=Acidithiobacillus thiooxidans TaxID=930 RepID=A0A1C2IQC6_ACITH|nr:glycosyltransferase [Acidithiobacillus thiooxidans]OCX77063.1 hypothetical protein A6P07_01185 [Acidithiobacillus thiooxidans]OCX78266.1 hypothetical protein A6O24_04855 [Acidithiobacillus thiooxidans]OCX78862.1 hypothetical protein A6O26_17600 [Acidithiobacillus thiooxidans]OCX82839.1 hypothetical protein A6M27_18465 [Acidithiobacillus thiooxidans]